jgi:hypothetical protein
MGKIGDFFCNPVTVMLVIGGFNHIKGNFLVPAEKEGKDFAVEVQRVVAPNAMNADALLVDAAVSICAGGENLNLMAALRQHQGGLLNIGGNSTESGLGGILVRDKGYFHFSTFGEGEVDCRIAFALAKTKSDDNKCMH